MSIDRSDAKARPFSSRSMLSGKIAVCVGLLTIAWTSFFVPDQAAKEIARIAGAALVLVGGLTYGFGMLIRAINRSARLGA